MLAFLSNLMCNFPSAPFNCAVTLPVLCSVSTMSHVFFFQKQPCPFVISESEWDLLVIFFKVQNTNNHLSFVPAPYMKNNCHNRIPPFPRAFYENQI